MLGSLFNNPLAVLLGFVGLVIAITVHEFSHAWAAERLGDPTPRLMGRLTLNPLAHLDPLGTILIIFVRFGWGKPVQFDPFNLRNPRRDSALISIAGPIANLLTATMGSILLRIILATQSPIFSSPAGSGVLLFIINFLLVTIAMNVMLGVFNIVPIHPLDGFKIVEGILPEEYAHQWHELERYGIIFLLFLLFPIVTRVAPISLLISPVINFFLTIFVPASLPI